MKLYAPKYFPAFKCIGGGCTKNCCIGWEIVIDGDTLATYQALGGGIGATIRESITSDGGYPHFRLCRDGRCPHLNSDNLCNIICECGDDMLCDICREHPRFYNLSPRFCEVGLGLACPTAAELILNSPDHSLTEIGKTDDEEVEECQGEYEVYRTFLSTVFEMAAGSSLRDLITYTDYHTAEVLPDLLFDLSIHPDAEPNVDRAYFLDRTVKPEEAKGGEVEAMLNILSALEVLDDGYGDELIAAWNSLLSDRDRAAEYITDNSGKALRLCEYFLYRHLHGGVEDGSVSARTRFAIISAFSVMAMSLYRGGREKITDAAIDYSRNIEYSDSNIATFIDLAEGDEAFGIGFITELLASKQK